jgi:hypothetical protein
VLAQVTDEMLNQIVQKEYSRYRHHQHPRQHSSRTQEGESAKVILEEGNSSSLIGMCENILLQFPICIVVVVVCLMGLVDQRDFLASMTMNQMMKMSPTALETAMTIIIPISEQNLSITLLLAKNTRILMTAGRRQVPSFVLNLDPDPDQETDTSERISQTRMHIIIAKVAVTATKKGETLHDPARDHRHSHIHKLVVMSGELPCGKKSHCNFPSRLLLD